jgi:hypothetical protein
VDVNTVANTHCQTHSGKLETDLHVLGELIVAVYVNGGKLPDVVELELDLQGLALPGVVPPADPTLLLARVVVAELEVVGARPAVGQQAQAPHELVVPVAVVGRVEELPIAPLVALGHRVRDYAVVPGAAVQLDPHADRPLVHAVRQETDSARPDRRLQVVLGLEVGVLVALDHLQKPTVAELVNLNLAI